MALTCKEQNKCYTRKDIKKCLASNAWIILLRTHENVFTSIGEASMTYRKNFNPVLENLIKAGPKDASARQKRLFSTELYASTLTNK